MIFFFNFKGAPQGAPNMVPPHGPLPGRAPTPGGLGAVAHASAPGGPSPLPGQQHPAMPPRGPTQGMPPTGLPPGGQVHPGALQSTMRPPVMNQHPEIPMSEPERIVIGNRVTVSNMDVANTAIRGGMPPPGYSTAAAMAAAQGAGLAAAAAAAAAARQQQFPYGQQYPYDYTAMYGAEWQQLMQQRDAAYAAAAYGLDKHTKVKFKDECITVTHHYPTTLRRAQITPKTSTNITPYLYSREPVRQVFSHLASDELD